MIAVAVVVWPIEAVLAFAAGVATVLSLMWIVMFGNKSAGDLRREARARRKPISGHDMQAPVPPLLSNLAIAAPLVGRDADTAAIFRLLAVNRAPGVLIKGPAGIGKSAVAFDAARQIQLRSETAGAGRAFDAIFQISAKAAAVTADGLAENLGRFLGYPSVAAEPTVELKFELIYRILVNTKLLLIIDNLETIDDPAVLGSIFMMPPSCQVLLTSRGTVSHERPVHVLNLSPLEPADANELLQREFDRLNLGRLAEQDPAAVQRLLALAGGSPLAIKWAAGRLGQGLTVAAVVARLESAHADLFEATFADNWTDIGDRGQKAIMALAMLGTSADGSIVTSALDRANPEAADDTVGDLVTISLFEPERDDRPGRRTRYGLHPLARAFARRKLAELPDARSVVGLPVARAILDYFNARRLYGMGKAEYDALERELYNLFNVFHWLEDEAAAAATEPVIDLLIGLADAVDVLLWSRGYWHERIDICRRTSEIAARHSRPLDAGRHAALVAQVLFWQGEIDQATSWTRDSRRLMAQGHELDLALSERLEALILHRRGHSEDAIVKMRCVLDVIRSADHEQDLMMERIRRFADWVCSGVSGYRSGELAIAQEIGIMFADIGQAEQAVAWIDESLRLADLIGDSEGASVSLSHKARALIAHDREAAKDCFEEGLFLARAVGRRSTEGRCLLGLAQVKLAAGLWGDALKCGRLALDIFVRLGMRLEASASREIVERAEARSPRNALIKARVAVPGLIGCGR